MPPDHHHPDDHDPDQRNADHHDFPDRPPIDLFPPNSSIKHIAVVIPARDESDRILAALDSVSRARRELPAEITSSCVVVADACVDDTERLARAHPGAGGGAVVVRADLGCVGAARAVGTRVAIERAVRAGYDLSSVWLANTDADTVVGRQWLTQQVGLGGEGVDAVAGIVKLGGDTCDVLRGHFRRGYALAPDGTHAHVHAANLGVRASTYLRANGWSPLPTGEDHDLWARLSAAGTCVSSASLTVRTSARLAGRAPDGFAADLTALATMEPVA